MIDNSYTALISIQTLQGTLTGQTYLSCLRRPNFRLLTLISSQVRISKLPTTLISFLLVTGVVRVSKTHSVNRTLAIDTKIATLGCNTLTKASIYPVIIQASTMYLPTPHYPHSNCTHSIRVSSPISRVKIN